MLEGFFFKRARKWLLSKTFQVRSAPLSYRNMYFILLQDNGIYFFFPFASVSPILFVTQACVLRPKKKISFFFPPPLGREIGVKKENRRTHVFKSEATLLVPVVNLQTSQSKLDRSFFPMRPKKDRQVALSATTVKLHIVLDRFSETVFGKKVRAYWYA